MKGWLDEGWAGSLGQERGSSGPQTPPCCLGQEGQQSPWRWEWPGREAWWSSRCCSLSPCSCWFWASSSPWHWVPTSEEDCAGQGPPPGSPGCLSPAQGSASGPEKTVCSQASITRLAPPLPCPPAPSGALSPPFPLLVPSCLTFPQHSPHPLTRLPSELILLPFYL